MLPSRAGALLACGTFVIVSPASGQSVSPGPSAAPLSAPSAAPSSAPSSAPLAVPSAAVAAVTAATPPTSEPLPFARPAAQASYAAARAHLLAGSFEQCVTASTALEAAAITDAERFVASQQAALCQAWLGRGMVLAHRSRVEEGDESGAPTKRTTGEIVTLYGSAVLYGLGTGVFVDVHGDALRLRQGEQARRHDHPDRPRPERQRTRVGGGHDRHGDAAPRSAGQPGHQRPRGRERRVVLERSALPLEASHTPLASREPAEPQDDAGAPDQCQPG